MEDGRLILSPQRFALTIERLAKQLIENYEDFSDTCIIGIQDGGVILAERIKKVIQEKINSSDIKFGKLDITFYRDDFRKSSHPLAASTTEIDFLMEGKNVILIDDVLYTGRTIQAAMSAIQDYGRAAKVELVTLIDRRFKRHLPVQPDYVGLIIDSFDEAYVRVVWDEKGADHVLMFSKKQDK